MAKYLIKAMILPMTGPKDIYMDGEIAIDSDKIISVGGKGSSPDDFQPDRIMELQNHVLMPGLINTHTHAAMTMLRGYADDMPLMPWLEEKIWPFEDRMSGEDVYWGTKLALCEMICSGTTTMVDMYAYEEDVAKAVLESGTRTVLSRGMIGLDPAVGEKALKEGIDLFNKFDGAGDGRVRVFLGPHAPYTCPEEYLKTIKREADRLKTGIHIHLSETLTELETIKTRTGLTPIRWLDEIGFFGGPVIAAHCVHVDGGEMNLFRKYGICVAHNAESNMKLNSGTAPVAEMLKQGILVGIGTDGASSNNDLDMFGEMRTVSLQHKLKFAPDTLSAYEVLEMATVGGAQVIGNENLGMLVPGFKADIIAIDFDQPHFYPRFSIPSHLVYCGRGSDVSMVMVDGKLLMEDKKLLTIDQNTICTEVEKRAKRIAREVNK
ncbi:MAG: amidohydrolase [Eubacteriales bacterium]